MAWDFRRAEVFVAYRRACREQGIEHSQQIYFMLLFWACHRTDWYDEPIPPPPDENIGAARRVVMHEVEQAAEAIGETLPQQIQVAFAYWCWRE